MQTYYKFECVIIDQEGLADSIVIEAKNRNDCMEELIKTYHAKYVYEINELGQIEWFDE